MSALKTARNITLSVIALIVVFGLAGVGYVMFNNQGAGPDVQPAAKVNGAEEPSAPPQPKMPSPNAPEGVAAYLGVSSVKPGSNASLTARTNATSTCTISVIYNGVPSRDTGLAPKTADNFGSVSWSWTVESTVPVGSWPVKVTCVYHGRSAVAETKLQVANQ